MPSNLHKALLLILYSLGGKTNPQQKYLNQHDPAEHLMNLINNPATGAGGRIATNNYNSGVQPSA